MPSYNPPRYLFRRHTILRKLKSGKSFLEVGAGNLKLSQELLGYFDTGTALDFEPGVKKIYAKLPDDTRKRLMIKIGDFFKLPGSAKYDCIVASEVMEHIEDDEKFLKKVRSLLKSDGQTIISVPAKDKYWSVHDEVVGHYRRYNKKQTEALFHRCGFKDVRVYSYGFPFINGFRLLRVMHGKQQSKTKRDWDMKKQTQKSGIGQIPAKYNSVGLLVNPTTFYPLNLFSSAFDNLDLSEGYVIVATK